MVNPAFYIFGVFLLFGNIFLFIYFIRKNKPIDIYTKELDYQTQNFLLKKENEKNKKEKEEKVRNKRKKLSAQYKKSEEERIEFLKNRNKAMKKEKAKSKEKKTSYKNEPPKQKINKTIINEKKEKDQKEEGKIPKTKKQTNELLSRKKTSRSCSNLGLDSDIISSNNHFKEKLRYRRKKHNAYIKKSSNNQNIVFINDNDENKINKKILIYDKNKYFSSCINQKAKITLDDILKESFE